jgi:6-pyruvoyl-tetrahydropterin synthase
MGSSRHRAVLFRPYLHNCQGRCENPHGHSYQACVTLAGEELEGNELLLDFKQFKEIIQPVVDSLDHQMISEIPLFTDLNPPAEKDLLLLRTWVPANGRCLLG